jgi:hypothetical protein
VTLLHQLWSRVAFAHSGDSYFLSGGNTYLRDYGPNGFHMRFAAGGAAPVPQTDGSLLFAGAQYGYFDGDLAWYYSKMPSGTHTWLLGAVCNSGPVYSSWNNATLGQMLLVTGSTMRVYQGQAAVFPYVNWAAGSLPSIVQRRVAASTVETTPRLFIDSSASTAAWAGGAFGVGAYSAVTIPRIGAYPNGGAFFFGRISYIALLNGAVSSPDLLELNRMMLDGGKPWCARL